MLKTFKDDLAYWSTFWNSFESSIHNNPNLTDVDKLNYLVASLDPPASDSISGLKITSVNYVGLLKKRYGNRQCIITSHMDILLAVESVTSQYNLKALQHLYDTVETQVRGLRALGVSSNTYGSLLSSVFMSKLPTEIRLVIARESREH